MPDTAAPAQEVALRVMTPVKVRLTANMEKLPIDYSMQLIVPWGKV